MHRLETAMASAVQYQDALQVSLPACTAGQSPGVRCFSSCVFSYMYGMFCAQGIFNYLDNRCVCFLGCVWFPC